MKSKAFFEAHTQTGSALFFTQFWTQDFVYTLLMETGKETEHFYLRFFTGSECGRFGVRIEGSTYRVTRKFIESKPYAFQGIGYSFEEALINLARLFDVPKNEANDLQWIAEAFGWDRLRWFLRGSWLIV